jgi:hypothetical protein
MPRMTSMEAAGRNRKTGHQKGLLRKGWWHGTVGVSIDAIREFE